MDPATTGLLISIAPTVLDLLFGRGNIIKHELLLENPKKMYGYGLEGYGYRYPRRRRMMGVESYYYPGELQNEFIKAAVFNRAIASKNPWIQHLKDTGVYDKIREELQKAKQSYKTKDPSKRAQTLARELKKLQTELNILQKEAEAKKLEPEFAQILGKK
jgi:hypothetical protein